MSIPSFDYNGFNWRNEINNYLRSQKDMDLNEEKEVGMFDTPICKVFVLDRKEDVSGVSGTGIVAMGAVFPKETGFDEGYCILTWLTGHDSAVAYNSLASLKAVHLHGDKTELRFLNAVDVYNADMNKLLEAAELMSKVAILFKTVYEFGGPIDKEENS